MLWPNLKLPDLPAASSISLFNDPGDPQPTLHSISIQARAVGGVPGIWGEAGPSGCVGKNKSYPHPDHNTINPSSIISTLLLPTTCPCPCPPGPGAVGGLPGGGRPAPGRAALPAPGGASPQLPVRPLQLPPGKLSKAGWRRAFAAPRQAFPAMMESSFVLLALTRATMHARVEAPQHLAPGVISLLNG